MGDCRKSDCIKDDCRKDDCKGDCESYLVRSLTEYTPNNRELIERKAPSIDGLRPVNGLLAPKTSWFSSRSRVVCDVGQAPGISHLIFVRVYPSCAFL